ncbi:hypothetical protein HTT03_06210 [Sulfitobacter sp. S0837]|uniref:DUF6998 domain-containing protein n=1 Tax=Sulfitobacter maritimus TaxID=2741719 RepID=UPI0015816FFD|nr:hypothetical protein [Sulfitobacter maritimus]NUH64892.1 hypothetical protein [Sulfitobacter maritimus]
MSEEVNWGHVADLLDDLYAAADGLERVFPGRKFTLDGHLVGSIDEVAAAYIFDLDLNPASTMRHDARSPCGRNVEIKLTQGRSVAIRHEPEHLIALRRPIGGPIQVVFNSPGVLAWTAAGRMQKKRTKADLVVAAIADFPRCSSRWASARSQGTTRMTENQSRERSVRAGAPA